MFRDGRKFEEAGQHEVIPTRCRRRGNLDYRKVLEKSVGVPQVIERL